MIQFSESFVEDSRESLLFEVQESLMDNSVNTMINLLNDREDLFTDRQTAEFRDNMRKRG